MIHIPGYQVIGTLQTTHRFCIYRAIRISDQQSVILKLPATPYPSIDEIRRFKYEYEILGEKNIYGTVRILGLTKHQYHPALVYEDVGGVPCSELLNAVPDADQPSAAPGLAIDEFLDIAAKAAEALAAVHQHDIVHRDIKPDNLLVNRDTGAVRITDFSCATLLSRGHAEAVAPTLLDCSLGYMSPEQTGRMNRSLDYRTDLYSLGISFYQLLTGQLPFVSDDPMEMIHCHIARLPQAPRQLHPSIPEPVSDIIMKLIAKTAEDRYQSAYGLMKDLQHCRQDLARTGTVNSFALAQHDIAARLQVSQKLYGRADEVTRLLRAFERMVQTGRTQLMLVAGYSGTGKTSLVREVHKPIVAQRGYFISGKYDLLNRDVPYSALITALRELVRQLLAEREAVIVQWKQRLADALGAYGQIIIDVIPDLEFIIDPQPPVPTLGPAESAIRFDRVFQNFIGVFARREHPLTIFLDDLQWADSASLRLIRLLATSRAAHYLLLLGAYRDNEVSPSHPFIRALDAIHDDGGITETVVLTPLQKNHVSTLLSDTLQCEPQMIESLAALLLEKTLGNPFFLWQMLTSFYNKGLVSRNLQTGKWQWDWNAITKARIAANVLELMTEKLHTLSSAAQDVLQLAACIGNRFSLTTVALVCEQDPQTILDQLWEVIHAGLVLPVGASTWLIGDSSQGQEFVETMQTGALKHGDGVYEYRFLHDQVQRAAYELIPAHKKKAVHLKIGRLMNQHRDDDSNQTALFDIVNHLNMGSDLIDAQLERTELARMNLAAAVKAKGSTAYQTALGYTRAGLDLLNGENAWETSYDLVFSLYIECAECNALCGQAGTAETLLQEMLTHVADPIHRASIYSKNITFLIGASRVEEVVPLGCEALRDLGIMFFDNPTEEQWRQQDLKLLALRAGRPIMDLIDRPLIDNPRMEVAVGILTSLIPALYISRTRRPHAYITAATTILNISLEYGYCDTIGIGYAYYGLGLTTLGRYSEAYEYGKLGLALNEKLGNFALNGGIRTFSTCFQSWLEHFRRCETNWHLAYEQLAEAGDYSHANFGVVAQAAVSLAQGMNLADLSQQIQRNLDWIQPMQYLLCYRIMRMNRQLVANLQGQTADRFSLDSDDFSEAKHVEWMISQDWDPMGFGCYYGARVMIDYLYGRLPEALAAGEECLRYEPGVMGLMTTADSVFYYALAILAAYGDMPPSEQSAYWPQLERLTARLKTWADNCPENFLNRYLLVAAEIARVDNKVYEAMELYDQAIASAQENEFVQNLALANELAAKFHYCQDRMQLARAYMTEARHAYVQWGAKVKVAQLDDECRAWWQDSLKGQTALGEIPAQGMTDNLDLMTIVKASRVLSSEIRLETLLDKIMREILHNAGAERGCLLLADGNEMRIGAMGIVRDDTIEISQPTDSEDLAATLCRALVDYTWRTGESVVVDNAENDACFANEHYVKTNHVKSLLCIPIQRSGAVTAILYLENNLISNAFTPDRVELLNLLSVQAAISLENATLYRDLKALNNGLETLVEERTAELKSAQKELLDKAHLAGMAEVAAETVHNVGNLLNSVVTSLAILEEQVASQPHKGLIRANSLLRQQLDHLADFFVTDPRGAKLIDYYFKVEAMIADSHAQFANELTNIDSYVALIKGVIYAQQSYAGSIALEESLNLAELVDQFLLLEEKSMQANGVTVETKLGVVDKVMVQKTKLMHILVNLFKNAREAMEGCEDKLLAVELKQDGPHVLLSMSDNGYGISQEVMTQIFRHGFTTKRDGHGFGLHSCINYMREMNGDIAVVSDGVGCGATFVLKFPAVVAESESHRLVEHERLYTNSRKDSMPEQAIGD